MKTIDLRSDTVTLPSEKMRNAMLHAPLGDDVFHEDPTVNHLESKAADMFGKEAAIFCPSGTQTNQIAIMVHTQPGGEVICHAESHIYKYEGGGIARNSLCSMKLLSGHRGRIQADQLSDCFNNPDDVHFPLTQLVSLEDTANRGGGAVYAYHEITKIRSICKARRLPLHLDGARIFNALAVSGMAPSDYAIAFDSISICLSKGLGAPVGSLLLGSEEFIKKARRVRKVLGGGMRQAGILAAAGIYALDHNVERLHLDHERARLLGQCLSRQEWVKEIFPVETNIVVAVLVDPEQRDVILHELANQGILAIAFGIGMIRFVTHLDIDDRDLENTIHTIESLRLV